MRKYIQRKRRPFGRAMGMVMKDVVMPTPDVDDWKTMLHGAVYRYARIVPQVDRRLLRQCKNWQRSFLKHNVLPLSRIMTFDEWLEQTNYSGARKEKLRSTWLQMGGEVASYEFIVKDFLRCNARCVKGFGKVENYPEYKPARGINPLGDEFMCLAGPLVKSIENAVFHDDGSMGDHHISRFFVKSIPVDERSRFIYERLAGKGEWYGKSDHSSFEAHMTPTVYNNNERVLYDYMAKDVAPAGLLNYFHNVNIHKNKINYGCGLTVSVIGRRMSGMPNTSLGNGYTNLVAGMFNMVVNGTPIEKADCVCEGDDGVLACNGIGPTEETYLKLGFEVKFERVDNVGDVGFCHIFFDDDEVDAAITDPRKHLAGFGWTHGQFMGSGPKVLKELLRAKGLSLMCEFPKCPILSVLAYKAIELTAGANARLEGNWKEIVIGKEKILSKTNVSCPIVSECSRRYMESHFNISVDTQRKVERRIMELSSWQQTLDFPEIDFDYSWYDFNETYRFSCSTHDDALNYA